MISQTILHICKHLAEQLSGGPTETMWEGHLQHHVAVTLLQAGWSLVVGESGGKNDRVAEIRHDGTRHSVQRRTGVVSASVDLVATKMDAPLNLQLKSYPSVGRKSGRAGVEKGLKKDLKSVVDGLCAFIFVADDQSYRALRGERAGARGPKIRWYLDLPPLEKMPLLKDIQAPTPGPLLGSFRAECCDRIVCGMWQPDHAAVWREGARPDE